MNIDKDLNSVSTVKLVSKYATDFKTLDFKENIRILTGHKNSSTYQF